MAPHDPDAVLELFLGFWISRTVIERARAVRPDFELTDETAPIVAEIARRFDAIVYMPPRLPVREIDWPAMA